MGKGSSSQPSGNTNPLAAAQTPFLTNAWGEAQNLYNQHRGPGNIADLGDPAMFRGLDALYAAGLDNEGLRPQATGVYSNATSGGMGLGNSPATPFFQSYAQGTSTPQQQMAGLYNTALSNGQNFANSISNFGAQLGANNNLGLSQLGQTAQGNYLNGNPWFSQMVQSALDPITRNFQTATAPQLDASFAGSGRYGSGAMLGQRENAQTVLADTLAKTSSGMYGQNFANERAQQLAAANQYGQLWNQGLSGAGSLYNTAGNQAAQGVNQAADLARQQLAGQEFGAQNLQSGYNTGNQAALNAAQMYPGLASAAYSAAQAAMQSGQGYNAWKQQYIDEPYKTLDKYLSQLGQPQQGQGIYTNPALETIAGISGGLNLLKQGSSLLGGGGTLGGLFGGGASALPATVGGTGAGMASALTGAAMEAAPAATTAGLAAAAPAAWIICTELVRQGRMPRKHWAAGARVFDGYPEVGKRGYYVWAIPTVRHLRRKPHSLYSRLCATVFRWRAEDLAARHGIKGARKLLRGRLVTAVLALPCLALGAVVPPQDWQQVYRDASA